MDDHAPVVHRFLASSLPPHEVDDSFQETFLSALRAYPRLADGSNLRAWVLTIASRKAIDGHRRRGRGDLSDGVPEVAAPPAPEDDPELWAAVRELPAKQRGAVVLRYVNDLTYREIARILDCSEVAARQSAKAGLDRLKEVWR
jgi:RNA polymerase sigma factor (sigma-70 family)